MVQKGLLPTISLLILTSCAYAAPVPVATAAPTPPAAAVGVILDPGAGDFLAFCDSPNLDVTVKVGSRQNSSSMEMGTARIAAGTSNFGRHTEDEIIYFVAGRGFATVGDQRRQVQPGSSMFVPRGVRHGFESTGTERMEFVWVTSPTGFESRLRGATVPSLDRCKAGP